MKPKFKEIMKPIVRYHNSIRIGFEDQIFEIEDSDGAIESIIHLLNGENTLYDISMISGWSLDEVTELIHMLDKIGVIEDQLQQSKYLSQHEQERYRANLTYFSNFSTLSQSRYSYQEKLKNAKVAILGLGGASLIAASFAGLGVGHIIGLDYDKVELSNFNRQFLYAEMDLNSYKINSAYKRLTQINSELTIEMISLKVDSTSSLIDLIKKVDFVINGIDTPGIISNRWVNLACVLENVPYIQGGIGNTKIIWSKILPGESGCYDCSLIHYLRIDPHFESLLRTLYNQEFERRNTAIAPHVALLSGFLSSETAKHLTGYAETMPASTTYEYDTLSMALKKKNTWTKVPECPSCGSNNIHSSNEPVDLESLISIAKEGVVHDA